MILVVVSCASCILMCDECVCVYVLAPAISVIVVVKQKKKERGAKIPLVDLIFLHGEEGGPPPPEK